MVTKVNEATVLGVEMNRQNLAVWEVSTVLRCSPRQVYNYMTRVARIKPARLGPLCDLLDMDADELIDKDGYLLPVEDDQAEDAQRG